MKIALVYPPLCDPTCGYLSLPYLASYVRARRSYDVSIVDANIDSLVFLSAPHRVAALIERSKKRLHRLGGMRPSSGPERHRLDDLHIGLGIEPGEVRMAMETMRDPARFYSYALYHRAASILRRWVRLLGTEGHGGMFEDFFLSSRLEINCCSLATLTRPEVLDGFLEPFRDYVEEELLPNLRKRGTDVIGIGVTYHEQLPFALALAREIRRALPRARIVMGGTDISQVFKFSQATGAFEHLLQFADAFVIGEGESGFLELLDAYRDDRPTSKIANVVSAQSWPTRKSIVPLYEPLDDLPTPNYADLPFGRYLSPERFVYYSPTRGCYWDRCTFCDYGLAGDRPTSPWRQRSLDLVVEDLRTVSREARFVYFSVDVIAPAYLVRLADRLIAERIDLRWGAELRLERYLDDSRSRLLRESGCVGLSVGFESGNQRILDLIDKGTNVGDTKRIIASLAKADICVQIMGFTGFPTETHEEALDSVALLEDLRSEWSFGGLGTFTLTAGAIVAKKPSQFGLSEVRPRPGDDVHCMLDYTESVPPKSLEQEEAIDQRIRALRHSCELPRPFVGGIDTAHSYFYFDRFHTGVRDELDRPLSCRPDWDVSLAGTLVGKPETGGEEVAAIVLPDGRSIAVPRLTHELKSVMEKRRTYAGVLAELRAGGLKGHLLGMLLDRIAEAGLLRFHPRESSGLGSETCPVQNGDEVRRKATASIL